MQTKFLFAALSAATLLAAGQASASVVLADTFDTDTLQTNWPGDASFVSSGPNIQGQPSTDLIGSPNFFDLLPGHGRYVDLDGSTGIGHDPAGVLTSVASFAAGQYTLHFLLAGNQRGTAAQTTTVSLGNFSVTLAPANNAPFTLHSYTFNTTGGNLVFRENGPSDQRGNLLDNVGLATGTPEPASWALMLMGFGGLGAALRARRRGVAAA